MPGRDDRGRLECRAAANWRIRLRVDDVIGTARVGKVEQPSAAERNFPGLVNLVEYPPNATWIYFLRNEGGSIYSRRATRWTNRRLFIIVSGIVLRKISPRQHLHVFPFIERHSQVGSIGRASVQYIHQTCGSASQYTHNISLITHPNTRRQMRRTIGSRTCHFALYPTGARARESITYGGGTQPRDRSI